MTQKFEFRLLYTETLELCGDDSSNETLLVSTETVPVENKRTRGSQESGSPYWHHQESQH
jgi:hypothetical protein